MIVVLLLKLFEGNLRTLYGCIDVFINRLVIVFLCQLNRINKRLLEMRPPDTLARLPRDMEKHFKNLKGTVRL